MNTAVLQFVYHRVRHNRLKEVFSNLLRTCLPRAMLMIRSVLVPKNSKLYTTATALHKSSCLIFRQDLFPFTYIFFLINIHKRKHAHTQISETIFKYIEYSSKEKTNIIIMKTTGRQMASTAHNANWRPSFLFVLTIIQGLKNIRD